MECLVWAGFRKRTFCAMFGFLMAATITIFVIYDGSYVGKLGPYFSPPNADSSNELQSQSAKIAVSHKPSGKTGGTLSANTMTKWIATPQRTIRKRRPLVIFSKANDVPVDAVWTLMLTGMGPVDIMVYPEHLDIHISGSLIRDGQWEPMEMLAMERLFQCDPELGLIDIGANIGVYVLLAAKYGRYSVGVEPSLDNISRLLKSVERNQFGKLVTLVRNAVSDRYTVLQLSANPVNRGNTVIRSDNNASLHVMGQDELKLEDRLPVGEVNTVLMDDLVPLVKFKRGILKIDIEGSEVLAFTHSSQFLSMIDVHYIFMEWIWIAKDPKGAAQKIYTLFVSQSYKPFADPYFARRLGRNYLAWPVDVFWVKGEICI